MKTALVFPGQGAQYPGMAQDLYEKSAEARDLFHQANEILGFEIHKLMFEGSEEDLKKTSVTQPAIFLHSVILAKVKGLVEQGHMAAGHSLGEFSALVSAGALSFRDGLWLVSIRANAMQKACDHEKSTMAAIVGLEDAVVEEICDSIAETVVPANYNSPGQIVVSGSLVGVDKAVEMAKERGARMAMTLQVDGAFHSPLMEMARHTLADGIHATHFTNARIPVYQNYTALPETNADVIKANLVAQLTGSVKWTQTIQNMVADGCEKFIEIGPGKVLQGLIKRIDRKLVTEGHQSLDGE